MPEFAGLTEAEREDLEASLRWHFAAYAEDPKSGYASAGVLTALGKVARIIKARQADAWDEGFTAAFYDPLSGSSAHDASESTRTNPYRATEEPS